MQEAKNWYRDKETDQTKEDESLPEGWKRKTLKHHQWYLFHQQGAANWLRC
jgi:hypothetical protein